MYDELVKKINAIQTTDPNDLENLTMTQKLVKSKKKQ